MLCSLSNLDESAVVSIQTLEKEIGKSLLSFSCKDIQPASVDEAILAKIKKLESDLGVSLVAVDS